MTSTINTHLWYPWILPGHKGREIGDTQVIQHIIRMTIPSKKPCRLLDTDGANTDRLYEAVRYNPQVQGTGLLQKPAAATADKTPIDREQQIALIATDILQYRAAPEFDVIYLFESLARMQAHTRKSILQYCRMLLTPGGRIVTAAAGNDPNAALQTDDIKETMLAAGLYTICCRRLTGTLQLVTAQRPLPRNA